MKKLSNKQMEKGLRHLQNAENALHRALKELVNYKKWCIGKNFIGGNSLLSELKKNVIDARIRLANLQRKYI